MQSSVFCSDKETDDRFYPKKIPFKQSINALSRNSSKIILDLK